MKAMSWLWILSLLLLLVFIFSLVGYSYFAKKGYVKENVEQLKIVAHRASGGVPENSLSAIKASIQMGVDMIELDVRLTKDGEIVVCHAESIDAATNGKGDIADLSLEEIKRFRMRTANGLLLDESLPTLGEVLELVAGRLPLLIDVKCPVEHERMAKAIINEVALYGATEWVVIQSADDKFLWDMYRLGNPCRLEKIVYFKLPGVPLIYDGCLTVFNLEKYNYISSFNMDVRFLSPSFVDWLHSHGKEVKIWTVDAPESTPLFKVDGVITDMSAEWLRLRH